MHIDHLVIIAGATASGKSSVIREIFAGRLHDIQARLGVHDFRHWACWNAAVIEDPLTTPLKYLVLEYDFLWHDLNQRDSGKHRAASLLDRAQEISFITVWTPPARLEKQFVDGRLRAALPPNWGGVLRSRLFRFLPRFAIRTLSGLPFWDLFNRCVPGTALLRGMLAERIYASPPRLIAVYRRWFESCEKHRSKTRGHWVVEYDKDVSIYTHTEWERRIAKDTAS